MRTKKKTQEEDPTIAMTLFPESAPEMESTTVPLDHIDGPLLGPEPGSDLIASIKSLGILCPLLVQRIGESDRYYIVDGRRRLKAAKKAEFVEVPVRVVPFDLLNPETMTLQTNMTRKANPISEYAAIKSLLDKGYQEKDIAKTLGIKTGIIKARLLLGKLIPILFELMEAGHISTSVGEQAAKLPEVLQEKLVAIFAVNDKLTWEDVAGLKRVKREEGVTTLSSAIFDVDQTKVQNINVAVSHLEAAKVLLEAAGLKVNLDTIIGKVKATS